MSGQGKAGEKPDPKSSHNLDQEREASYNNFDQLEDNSTSCDGPCKDSSSDWLSSENDDPLEHIEESDWLPPKPVEPLQEDCCGTGCTPCVFDIYDQEINLWRKECKRIRLGLKKKSTENKTVLSRTEYRKFEITEVRTVNHDTRVYRFRIEGEQTLGLGAGQHLILREGDANCSLTRQYTPVSRLEAEGYFDILIKIYDGGQMSDFVKTWQRGQFKEWRGPFGNFSYSPNSYRRVVMFAAGTGIAPMIQVIRDILSNDEDETFVHLVYACRTYTDILLREELHQLMSHWNFTVLYMLSQDTPEGTAAFRKYSDQICYGRLDLQMLKKEISNSSSTLVLICGTKSFDKDIIKYLKLLDYDEKDIFKF